MGENEIKLIDMWRMVWRKKIFIIKIVAIVTVLAIVLSLILPKWYSATAVILPPSSGQSTLGAAALLGNLGFGNILGENQSQSRYLAILKSKSLLAAVAKKFNLQEKYGCDNMEKTLQQLEGNMQVDVGDEMQISVTFFDKDQEMVAKIANYAVHILDSLNIMLATTQANNNRQFIESRVNIVLDSLSILENEITRFMKKNDLLSINEQVSVAITKAADLKAQMMSKEIELAVAKKLLDKNSSQIAKLKLQLQSIQSAYNQFFSDATKNKLFPNLENIPELEKEYIRLKRKAEYFTKLLEYLGPQYEQAKIEAAKTVPTVQVLDQAVRPERKVKPKRAKIVIISFVISLILSLYIAYFRSRWEDLHLKKK